jgi:hypothetical protein
LKNNYEKCFQQAKVLINTVKTLRRSFFGHLRQTFLPGSSTHSGGLPRFFYVHLRQPETQGTILCRRTFFPRIFVFVFLIEPFYIIVTDLDKPRHVANCERGAKATILVNKVT